MTELLTAAQMRAIEAAAIESGQVTGQELMERAGQGVVEAIFEEWPDLRASSHRAVVLCGPGNNGGDGFVVARLLKDWGWTVRVLAATVENLPPDAATNAKRWLNLGSVEPLSCDALKSTPSSDLYIDAIFGTGLSRAPDGEIAEILAYLGGRGADRSCFRGRLVAIDAPSGLCLDSGRCLMAFSEFRPAARLTVTFDSPKAGHFLDEGPAHCGRVVVKDIGIAPWRQKTGPVSRHGHSNGAPKPVELALIGCVAAQGDAVIASGAPEIAGLSKRSQAAGHVAHKYSHGHALVLSGGIASGGAARLAARAALRIGAGLVTLGCPPSAVVTNAAHLNAIMLRPIADAAALADALTDRRINALCLGPGMGTTEREAALLTAALDQSRGKPLAAVLDADALTLLARDAGVFGMLHKDCILTPHAGEFARLFPDIAARLAAPATRGPAYSKVDATREAAHRAGCVVLFKGPDTVIAAPDGRCSVHAAAYDRAAPWLATAGSGDVLAGFITGLLARGFAPMQAAETAAWLHAECALSFGPGLIAEDLPEEVPKVLRTLRL